MEIRHATNPVEAKSFDTESLRERYLVRDLFAGGDTRMVYTHHDRMILGGAVPTTASLNLDAGEALKTEYFLERREVGVFNIGSGGFVDVDGERHEMGEKDCLYVGLGKRELGFGSEDPERPARFYFVSAPAHREHPTRKMTLEESRSTKLGAPERSNVRTLNRYIHGDGIKSCQLMMGLTELEPGSVWNTMPSHTHDRRSEVYLYLGVPEGDRIIHLMGEPGESRHLVAANEEAVISPSWSMHAGAGTSNYSFIWAMAGENYTFDDMDHVSMDELR